MKPKIKFPVKVKRDSVTVTIYRTPTGRYESFTLAYWLGGKRCRQVFSDYSKARREAEFVAVKLSRGEAEVLKLTSTDRSIYLRATAALKPMGVPLDVAVADYVAASRILGGRPLVVAAKDYAQQNPLNLTCKTVVEVVEEFIASKEAAGLSQVYVDDLRHRCKKFSRAFRCQINDVRAKDVQTFLGALKLSARSHNNFLAAFKSLYTFAKKRSYVPKDWDEIERVDRRRGTGDEITIFRPEELVKLLRHAPDILIAPLVIQAFAGLRASEVRRLNWHEIHLAEKFIEIKKGKAKTRSRRLAPVPDNLAAWLTAVCKPSHEKVWPHSKPYFYEALHEVCKAAGLEWQDNGLRHSFVSYRLAATMNENQVALETGHSPKMLFSNYRSLTTAKDAASWFSILPASSSNVIILPNAAEAS